MLQLQSQYGRLLLAGGTALAIGLGIAKSVIIIGSIGVLTFPITTTITEGMISNNIYLPQINLSPKEVFSNEVLLLDVDFFNPMEGITKISNVEGDVVELESTAAILQTTISKWYNILRDIAIVASLSILVYVGIRILLSSASSDKAKYKQMIMDWVIALCLLFVMQYIMSFSNIVVDKVTDIVKSITTNTDTETAKQAIADGKLDELESTSYELFIFEEDKVINKAWKTLVQQGVNDGNYADASKSPYYQYFLQADGTQATNVNDISSSDAKYFLWPTTNEISQVRMRLQLLNNKEQTYVSIGYKLIYVVLVIFTFIFLFTYIKRVLYMAFLTIIAPLVAMTYLIDKINDGKAQAFDSWLKEYIFNLLIQPMHLIIYTILIGSAIDLAATNVVYSVCALGFMIPAEKLMRKFFGFEKAQTPGLLAGPAGAAMVMSGMNKLLSKGGKGSSGKGNKSDSEKEEKPPRLHDEYDPEDDFAPSTPPSSPGSDDDDSSLFSNSDSSEEVNSQSEPPNSQYSGEEEGNEIIILKRTLYQ